LPDESFSRTAFPEGHKHSFVEGSIPFGQEIQMVLSKLAA